MNVLFVMEHPGIGSLVPALRLLASRGHRIHLAYEVVKSQEAERELASVVAEFPQITSGPLPVIGDDRFAPVASWLRRASDFLRYLEPRYAAATKLRARAARKAPPAARRLGSLASAAGPAAVAASLRALRLVERCIPPPPVVERYLREHAPDVLLLANLLEIGAGHADYLRAARRLGIRSVFPVRGWDNLTNKGLLRDAPELVLVWNDLQAREAEELHRIPRDRIRVTGAPSCDQWFGREPSRSREEFCRDVGLRPDRPIVLYVCSSVFVAPDEVGFVRRWIDGLRSHGGILAEAGLLVRPHPLNAAQWAGAGLEAPQVRVWPPFGEAPHDEASRRNFFDSIFHAGAVVGINTTAQIESAIVGRPVHTLLAEEFRETQEGTLHFHYLKAGDFGHLRVARTLEEHAAQLEESLRSDRDDRSERFLRRFVRPLGLDVSATETLVSAIEELASRPAPAPDRGPALAALVRHALAPVAARSAARAARSRERLAARSTPARELRRTLSKLVRDRKGVPVVAGPWLGDEIGELLYWVPLLRRAESQGLRGRLFVLHRASSAPWYAGLAARCATAEVRPSEERVAELFGFGRRAFRALAPELVQAARPELAADPTLLEFVPLPPEEPNERGFVGPFGAAAIVAVLRGVPAVVSPVAGDDLPLLASLPSPPFGALRVAEAPTAAAEPAGRC